MAISIKEKYHNYDIRKSKAFFNIYRTIFINTLLFMKITGLVMYYFLPYPDLKYVAYFIIFILYLISNKYKKLFFKHYNAGYRLGNKARASAIMGANTGLHLIIQNETNYDVSHYCDRCKKTFPTKINKRYIYMVALVDKEVLQTRFLYENYLFLCKKCFKQITTQEAENLIDKKYGFGTVGALYQLAEQKMYFSTDDIKNIYDYYYTRYQFGKDFTNKEYLQKTIKFKTIVEQLKQYQKEMEKSKKNSLI